MSRYSSYGPRDTQAVAEGDNYFKGLDLKHDRALLGEGMVAKSINKRLRTGMAATRPGTRLPADFNPVFGHPFIGSFVYSNPNGNEVLLVAEQSHSFIWEFRDGFTPKQVPITGGGAATGTTPICFVQAFDKVLLLRSGLTPLIWDGLDYTAGFKPVTKFDPSDTSTILIGTGAPPLNQIGYGISFQNRVLYVCRDHILMSDVLDYLSYDPVLADFRINGGEADRIVCIHPYSKESVLVFMKRSIHRFSNFTIDPNLASQEIVSDELGAVGREAAAQVGADIIFLSRAGIYRVNQVFENQTVSAPVPISDLISPLLEGINWDAIEQIGFVSMAMLGDYCYMALPIGRNFPRNILVYNTVTSQWESVDAWEDTGFYVNALRVTMFDGERRLYGINNVLHHVYLLYEGITDQTGVTNFVNDILETRGYFGRDPLGFKRFDRVHLALRTLAPLAGVYALSDGYNEVKYLTPTPITKSTAKFYIWGHKDFNPATDDPDEPKREDYNIGSETEWVAQDMDNLLPGQIDLLPGVDAEMLGGPTTESLERFSVRQIGRWCSIRILNIQGTCDILAVSVDAQEKQNVVRTAA